MKKYRSLFLLIMFLSNAAAQTPDTDIFLVEVKIEGGKYLPGKPVNITNRPGYDNQPSFTSDGTKIFYTSMRDSVQTDIWVYNIHDSASYRMTETPESEYSPVMLPDGKHISSIVVNDKKAQHFCTINLDDKKVSPVISREDSAAYYAWLSPTHFAMCILNNGMNLKIYNLLDESQAEIASNVGRCLVRYPRTEDLCFIQKSSGTEQTIMRYSHKSGPVYAVGLALAGSEDFVIMPDGKFLMGSEGKLFVLNVFEKRWIEVADFSDVVGKFYRIVASPDGKRIALVGYSGKKP